MNRYAKQCKNSTRTPSRTRRSLVAIAALLGFGALAGCNEHPVGTGAAPEFRGITIPLPPPSFRQATLVDVELSGVAPGFEEGRALAWDAPSAAGVTGAIDASGAFVLPSWSLKLRDHCIEVRAEQGFERPSNPRYFDMELKSGEDCASSLCSAKDGQGECLCLASRAANCVDRQPGEDPSSSAAPGTSSGAPQR